jgi:hypothetical protein
MLGAAPLLSLILLGWLMQPEHWTQRDYPAYDFLPALDIVMLVAIGLIEFFRCMNVLSNAHATLVARDPIPVVPETGTRVAFITTFVPGKEPLEMVTKTLEAAVRLRHRGLMHVWLLDEGDDPEVKAVCGRLGVHHFTRKGVEKWNRPRAPHRAKTKHGNYNAWLEAHGDEYDYFASVDTDHVPLPNYLERMLGFFRDPDVGFVIGPQVYGNYDNPVTKAAESQQFLFHALIQRAGNRYGSPMFVGTSNAVRIKALQQIGGLYDSITEDMATGFEMHRPRTRRRARSGVGLHAGRARGRRGPSAWTDFFTQQTPVVARDVRDDPQAVLEGLLLDASGQALQLHDDDHLLPDVGPQLDPGGAELRPVPGPGRLGCEHRPDGVADALRQRVRAADRPLHLEPAAQRLPARAGGLRRCRRHGDVRAVGADLRPLAAGRRTAPQEQVRGHAEGRFGQPGHAVRDVPGALVLHPDLRRSLMAGLRERALPPGDDHWATFALLITASPILAWRYMMRQEKKGQAHRQPPGPARARTADPPGRRSVAAAAEAGSRSRSDGADRPRTAAHSAEAQLGGGDHGPPALGARGKSRPCRSRSVDKLGGL